MKKFASLSNSQIVQDLKALVKIERDTVVEILWHLREIDHRRIHLDSGFPSLFEYCTEELGYSAGAASRRIASMRLLKELPEIEPKIRSGELHLSQLAQAQHHFRQEKKEGRTPAPEVKLEVLQSLAGKSTRETERILVTLNPKNVPTERQRALSEELTEICFVASSELMKKIEAAKNQFSHSLPDAGYAELFERLLDEALKKKPAKSETDAALRPTSEVTSKNDSIQRSESVKKAEAMPGLNAETPRFSESKSGPEIRRHSNVPRPHIPATLKRAVFERAGNCCEYQDATTGRRCRSRYQLQVDHVQPLAKGGATTFGNLRLLCRQHNFRAAEKILGRGWMMRVTG